MEDKIVVNKITKLLATVMIVLGILITLTPLCLFGYYNYNVYTLKKETYGYLSNRGYEENEIKKIEVVNVKGPLLSSMVEFVDEPNVVYWYDKKDGEIVQIGIYESNDDYETKFKHVE
ncbi:hypothetical protein CD30_18400 [Ureibacillus massiliensis 4400831 = CIP 108448 = CCUG 49529]|uniref:DUF3139 domain-containing protein n=1 Tax=Ureibacillus massiliensis 4400831 = CIP 108448 = CCUG 49529 TaxID=1211035 RepID=A0A0A3JMU2_9BACL|nr:DUF3139 domain-containing protein [Ureibacillus massiliensis]KGR88312.1 hypothetical protein CD30_18400 [Ureibacillus massiliensis 4400831 = CIP 108448 = CCUG 49529]